MNICEVTCWLNQTYDRTSAIFVFKYPRFYERPHWLLGDDVAQHEPIGFLFQKTLLESFRLTLTGTVGLN